MECENREVRRAAAMERVSERISDRLSEPLRIPSLRRHAFRDSRNPCVDRRAAINAWSATIASCDTPR
eukprot:5566899-Lingulodinium_polyedra.AAC.1